MTGVLLCFLVASVRVLTERWDPANLRLLAALVLGGAFSWRATTPMRSSRCPRAMNGS